jgi:hypothetical protein
MSITHTLTISVTTGGVALSKSFDVTDGSELNISEPVADAAANLEIAFAAVRAKLKSFYMVADQVLTVETNDGTTPDDTFTLVADRPVTWYEGCGVAINDFLSADITSIFASNASGDDATLVIKAVIDPT